MKNKTSDRAPRRGERSINSGEENPANTGFFSKILVLVFIIFLFFTKKKERWENKILAHDATTWSAGLPLRLAPGVHSISFHLFLL